MGTAFRMTLDGALDRPALLYAARTARFPTPNLSAGSDGLLYGTTMFGGTGSGVIFKMTRAGVHHGPAEL